MRLPAEWEPHQRCVMAWPVRDEIWFGRVDEARRSFAEVSDAIVAFEPVMMVVAPGLEAEARTMLPAAVDILTLPLDDSWTRDTGPIVVVDDAGRRAGVDARFNSWGETFLPYDDDAVLARRLLDHLGIERIESSMVLEGGAIAVDGAGLLLTTSSCIDHPNRNPTWTAEEIDGELRRLFGVERIVRLPAGIVEDWHTDGHVDMVAAFVGPGVVLAQGCDDPTDPNHEVLARNVELLRSTADSSGRSLDVVEIPHLPSFEFGGETHRLSHVNAYLANDAVIVPIVGAPETADTDAAALATWSSVCPDREIVGVAATPIFAGGGGIHCITQQIPS